MFPSLLLSFVLATAGAETETRAEPVEVPSMLIKLIEQADVPARETGVLAAVHVVEGQTVEERDVLAQIDDAEAVIAGEQTKIELEVARANAKNDINIRFAKKSVEVAKAELRRATESVRNYAKSVSEAELDRLRLLVEKSTLETEQAQHEFTVAGFAARIKENECEARRQKVERHKILAPIGGVVVQVNRHRGEWVKPGDPVLRIVRLDRLRAEGFIRARFVDQKLRMRRLRLTVDLPEQPAVEFPAKIVFVDPEVDPLNAQVRIWVEVQNSGMRLRPGMRANMTFDPLPQQP